MEALPFYRGLGSAVTLLVLVLVLGASPLRALVISEIHYHPRGESAGSRRLEFIELYNEDPDPVELTGYSFAEGIVFAFDARTFLAGRSYLVVAADAALLREVHGIENVDGDWDPSTALDNAGERISLANPGGAVVATVRYDDRGRWPAGADGTGHTLALLDPYTDIERPESWGLSLEADGTPGRPNFPQGRTPSPVVLNEALLLTAGARWVELFNRSDSAVDLSGHYLTNDPERLETATLPEGTLLAPYGWAAFTEAELGFDLAPTSGGGVFVALVEPSGARVLDAFRFVPQVEEASEARLPDGAPGVSPAADPTPGAANRVTVAGGVVLNELHYHPMDEDSDREFVELFNHGGEAVEIGGWWFSDGISFEFPVGTSIGAGEYLVVARDPERIRGIYGLGEAAVLGPASEEGRAAFGVLRDSGERVTLRDARGNVVDTVEYRDGGEWPGWADGGGSTLELIDPAQENDTAQAWDSSDDSAKAAVETFEYTGRYAGGEPEFHLVLLARGIAVVDDVYLESDLPTTELRAEQEFVAPGDTWKYWKGTSAPGDGWRDVDFDDSGWADGLLPIGYGEPELGAVLDDMRFGYLSVFLRRRFEVEEPDAIEQLLFQLEFDDGYVAYLNGVEVGRANMDLGTGFDFPASSSGEAGEPITVDLAGRSDLLRRGTNVVAIQVHNNIINSPDLYLDATLFAGEVVDVAAGWNMLPGGDFESPLDDAWLLQGTHLRSGRSESGAIAGGASLKLVANGSGDQKVNRVEREVPKGLLSGKSYRISLQARWVVGSASLLTRGYMQDGDASMARSHALSVPEDVGTPGGPNGVYLRQIERAGAPNLGPVIDRVTHEPPLPRGGQAVTVRARIRDSDGMADARVRFAPSSPLEALTPVPLAGPDRDGFYSALLPGQPLGTPVVYEVVAEDAGGRAGRWPRSRLGETHPLLLDPANAGPLDERWAVYLHAANVATRHHSYRFVMDDASESYLLQRPLHSDDYVEGSLLYDARTVYQGAGLRFKGTLLRGGLNGSFWLRMPRDAPLHGRLRKFGLDASAFEAHDRINNYLIRYNSGGLRVPYYSQSYALFQLNDRPPSVKEHVDAPGREFVSRWFPEEDDGHLFELNDRIEFSDSGAPITRHTVRWLYPPYRGSGEDKENYRFFFTPQMHEGADDYSPIIATAKVLDPAQTSDAEFDVEVQEHFHVEELLRNLAIRLNTGDFDTWGGVLGKNAFVYRPRSGDTRWTLIPWDMDISYGRDGRALGLLPLPENAAEPIRNAHFPEVERMLNRPRIKRMYYGILAEMVEGHFSSGYLAPLMDRLQASGASPASIGVGRPGGFIDQRAELIRGWIESSVFPARRLEITTAGGEPFGTGDPAVSLEGMAPLDVQSIVAARNGVALEREAGFSDSDAFAWSLADLALDDGPNEIVVYGLSSSGEVVDTDSIAITRAAASVFLRGDANLDGRVNVSDVSLILASLAGGAALACADAADVDDNGRVEALDALRLLEYLFLDGEPPAAPAEAPGEDPTSDALTCRAAPDLEEAL